ncbi:MAG: right-handed parallel beta-helix repeat-containing protein [Chitinophagales bacterium]|nr:right-handed parallel beta-helix repeat-containing protein [Chitinophagales bacterium]MDW8394120.1 right-handed parallel beta-helix repeat-containing protein [Chitinophagales bacterium]
MTHAINLGRARSILLQVILVVAWCAAAAQSSYYLSPSGNDANNGTSPAQAWRTLARASQQAFQPGDSLLLESGGVYRGTLWLHGSGTAAAPIVISSYGAGSKPLISGEEPLQNPSWSSESDFGTTVWKTPCPDTAWFVFADNQQHFPARFPDEDYYYMDQLASSGNLSFCGKLYPRDSVFISNALKNTAIGDLTGAYASIRMSGWTIGTFRIVAFDPSAGKVWLHSSSYGWNGSLNLHAGTSEKYGFFLSNKKEFLSQGGEFWHDASGKQLYLAGAAPPAAVAISRHRYGIRLMDTFARYVVIRNVAFSGQHISGIELKENDSDISIISCSFSRMPFGLHNRGQSASADCLIRRAFTFRLNVSGNSFTDIFREAISCFPRDATISYNTIRRTGLRPNLAEWLNMPRSYDVVDYDNGSAIRTGRNCWIAYNTVDSCGLYGIFVNAQCTAEYNLIEHACLLYSDCGGLYVAYSDSAELRHNVIRNCGGNTDRGIWLTSQAVSPLIIANGIYLDFNADLRFQQLRATRNTIAHCGRGIALITTEDALGQPNLYGNGYCSPPAELTENILYDNFWEQFNIAALSLPQNVPSVFTYKPLHFADNALLHFDLTGKAVRTSNRLGAGVDWGDYQSNTYLTLHNPYPFDKSYVSGLIEKTEWLTLSEWKQSGDDISSRQIVPLQSHITLLDTLQQGNLVRNGHFHSDVAHWNYTKSQSLCNVIWQRDSNTVMPSGHLFVRNPSGLACLNNTLTVYTQLADSSNNYSVTVNLDSSRYYLLSFRTYTNLVISNSGKPNTFWTVSIINSQNSAVLFSTVIEPRTQVETIRLIFRPAFSAAEAKLQFFSYKLQDNYDLRLDDVVLLPVSVTEWTPDYKFPLLTNASNQTLSITVPPNCFIHLDSSAVSSPLTLSPFTSVVLIRLDTCTLDIDLTGLPPAAQSPMPHRLLLYPNPATDFVILLFPPETKGQNLQLFNLSGRLMFSRRILEPMLRLSIADWAAGMYLVRCGTYYTKFVKN